MMPTKLSVMGFNEREIKEKIDRARANTEWLQGHIKALREKYTDKFVAVDNKKVIGSHEDLKSLVSSLKKEYTAIDTFAIEFIPKEDFIWII
jgi:uncharacterized protein YecE (DUF72 family)